MSGHTTGYEYLGKLEQNLTNATYELRKEHPELVPGLLMLLSDAKQFQRLYHLSIRNRDSLPALREFERADKADDFFDERAHNATDTDPDPAKG